MSSNPDNKDNIMAMKEVMSSCVPISNGGKEGRKRYLQVVAVLPMVFSGNAND